MVSQLPAIELQLGVELQLGAVELQLGAIELQWLQEEEGKDAILDMKYAGLLSRQVDDVVDHVGEK